MSRTTSLLAPAAAGNPRVATVEKQTGPPHHLWVITKRRSAGRLSRKATLTSPREEATTFVRFTAGLPRAGLHAAAALVGHASLRSPTPSPSESTSSFSSSGNGSTASGEPSP